MAVIRGPPRWLAWHGGKQARFARIHRSTIVSLTKIRELRPKLNGGYAVFLHSGAKLTLSRGYRDALLARLGADW